MVEGGNVESGKVEGRIRSGLFEVDLTAGELYKSGRRIALQEQPFRLLSVLLERPGELIPRRELRARLWPADTNAGFEEGLNTAVRKLRTAFGDLADNPRFIETVIRRGYRFIAPVARVERQVSLSPGESTSVLPPEKGDRHAIRSAAFAAALLLLVALVLAAAILALRPDVRRGARCHEPAPRKKYLSWGPLILSLRPEMGGAVSTRPGPLNAERRARPCEWSIGIRSRQIWRNHAGLSKDQLVTFICPCNVLT